MVGIKTLAHNFPGRREAEAQGKDSYSLHGSPPKGGCPNSLRSVNSTSNDEDPFLSALKSLAHTSTQCSASTGLCLT